MNIIMRKIRYVQFADILSPLIFILMIAPSILFKLYNKLHNREIWLICEDGQTARDNGYYFYKYMREKHSSESCYYVINKSSTDYNIVKKYNNIIQFGSLKHWLYYLSSKYNISNHKHGNPCQPLFYIIHVLLGLYNNRVFLQHGITKDDSPWLYYKNTKFRYFVCGAKDEYEYVKEKFGYPQNNLIYTGLARFDGLHDYKVNKKKILVMPTWRNWMGGNYYSHRDFTKSTYYLKWNSFINNEELNAFLEENNYKILFYPHQHMQKYIKHFNTSSKRITIANAASANIQEELKTSQYLITDYSSVFMDFAYMEKLCIFYQFDSEEYRKHQLQEGYYKYENGFGPVYEKETTLVNGIKTLLGKEIGETYIKRMRSFFEVKDKNNCERIYKALKNSPHQ